MFGFTGGWLKCFNLNPIIYSVLADFNMRSFIKIPEVIVIYIERDFGLSSSFF